MAITATLGERRTLEIEDGPIEYRVTGQGPTIVFLHGIIANGDVWRGVVSDLLVTTTAWCRTGPWVVTGWR